MLSIGQIFRLLTIQRVLLKHGLDELVFTLRLFRPVRWLQRLLPWNWFRKTGEPGGVRLRLALEDLGPIYVKFGQQLSTRRDMLPDDVALELAKLQDKVPPFPGSIAREIIERSLGKKIEEIFTDFDETALASASVAQVHAATLKDGREMIVKVIRPGIKQGISRDLGIINILAETLERYSRDAKRLRPTSVVAEFEKTLFNELDLMREAASASQLRRNFSDSDVLYVPEVVWELTSRDVMVMERVSGIPVSDTAALEQAGVDLKWLAERGVEIFFTQVFRDSFFHADMHPGNIFVQPGPEGRARIMMVDFGIMSSLSEYDQRYLADNFLAFLNRDYRRVAELHIESGWVPPETRVDEFEFAIRTVCEPMFDRPIRQMSVGTLLLRLFRTARQFNMVILPQLLLLQKTLVNIEGLGRQLHPDLDLWATAKPIMQRWMDSRVGLRALVKGTRDSVPYWLNRLPQFPHKVMELVDRLQDGRFQVELKPGEVDELRRELRRNNRNNIRVVLGCALVLAALVSYLLGPASWLLSGFPLLPLLLGAGRRLAGHKGFERTVKIFGTMARNSRNSGVRVRNSQNFYSDPRIPMSFILVLQTLMITALHTPTVCKPACWGQILNLSPNLQVIESVSARRNTFEASVLTIIAAVIRKQMLANHKKAKRPREIPEPAADREQPPDQC